MSHPTPITSLVAEVVAYGGPLVTARPERVHPDLIATLCGDLYRFDYRVAGYQQANGLEEDYPDDWYCARHREGEASRHDGRYMERHYLLARLDTGYGFHANDWHHADALRAMAQADGPIRLYVDENGWIRQAH